MNSSRSSGALAMKQMKFPKNVLSLYVILCLNTGLTIHEKFTPMIIMITPFEGLQDTSIIEFLRALKC